MKTKTIAVANRKGGIGKTTTSIALASIMREWGYKTLLIDSDSSMNASNTYGVDKYSLPHKIKNLYDVFLEEDERQVKAIDAIQHTKYGDIIAGSQKLEKGEVILALDSLYGLRRFKIALDELKQNTNYDFIIIDTNPLINNVLRSVLVAADEVIVPITADGYGMLGIDDLSKTIKDIKKLYNPNLKTAGILLVRYLQRTVLAQTMKEDIKELSTIYESIVFNSAIRECNSVREAQTALMPLNEYSKNCITNLDYKDFIREYLSLSNIKIKEGAKK